VGLALFLRALSRRALSRLALLRGQIARLLLALFLGRARDRLSNSLPLTPIRFAVALALVLTLIVVLCHDSSVDW
jgi:hypothetical protein